MTPRRRLPFPSPLAARAPETEAERDAAERDSCEGLAAFAHLDALAYTSRGATFAAVAAHLRVAPARRSPRRGGV